MSSSDRHSRVGHCRTHVRRSLTQHGGPGTAGLVVPVEDDRLPEEAAENDLVTIAVEMEARDDRQTARHDLGRMPAGERAVPGR